MNSSSSRTGHHPALAVDRFDLIMISTILILIIVVGLVVGTRSVHSARVLYLDSANTSAENLWIIDPNMPNVPPVRLTNSQNGIVDFDVANDGSIIYSEQATDSVSNLMRYDMAHGQPQLLYTCKDASCKDVALRPDGKVVAFDRFELNTGTNMPSSAPRIWLLDITTGQAEPLYPDSQQLGYAAHWSADGKRLVIYDTSSSVMLIHDFITGKDVPIMSSHGIIGAGTFSPDGKRLWFPKVAVEAQQQYTTHIAIVDLSTDVPTQYDLLPDAALDADMDPIWSIDSQSLIVLRRQGDQSIGSDNQIFQVNATTGQAKALVVAPQYTHSNLNLNSSGDQLVFQRLLSGDPEARPEIWLYDFKTGQTRKLANNGNAPRWLP